MKLNPIPIAKGVVIPVLYDDGAVMGIDKPAGWLLAPESWDRTGRNLHLALRTALSTGAFWARSRNLRYLRFIHRLDADTSGVLLLAKSPGGLRAFSRLFESRSVEKVYLAVVRGIPQQSTWTCTLKLGPHPTEPGRVIIDPRHGKEAITRFTVLRTGPQTALVQARPLTGRTHQIRVHLASAGHPVLNDPLYGEAAVSEKEGRLGLALRAISLAYVDPFRKRPVRIAAPWAEFVQAYDFKLKDTELGWTR